MRSKTLFVFVLLMLAASTVWAAPSHTPITLENAAQVTDLGALTGHTGPVFSLAFSPDSTVLVSGGSRDDYSVRVWDVETSTQRADLEGHTGQIAAVAFNDDGTQVASASYDHSIRLWDATSGALVETQDANAGYYLFIENLNVRFVDGDSKLIYGFESGYAMYSWDVVEHIETGVDLSALNIPSNSSMISSDGLTLAVGDESTLHIVDVATVTESVTIPYPPTITYPNTMIFSPDGKTLAITDFDSSVVQLFDLVAGQPTAVLTGHEANSSGSLGIYGLAWSPDGTMLATGSYDKTIRIWDVVAGTELVKLDAPGEGVGSLAWSPDGSLLASGDLDGTIHLWGIP